MPKVIYTNLFVFILLFSNIMMFSQNSTIDSVHINLEIPDEIISRIPENQVAHFIISRQRVIGKKDIHKFNSAFDEIGVNVNVLNRIPEINFLDF